MSHSPRSEIRRPMTRERRARIDARSAEMDAALRHEIWADRIAKATVIAYVALVVLGFYRAANGNRST
jgi:hypothetical protein